MLIDFSHPLVRSLSLEWQKRDRKGCSQSSLEFQERLARETLPLVQPFAGELGLLYHEFLTMAPSGAHSFAHGTEMVSRTVYWLTAVRLSAPVSLVEEKSPGSEWGNEEHKIRIAPSTSFLLSTLWQCSLYPYYPGESNRPSFRFNEPRGMRLGWTARSQEPAKISTPRPGPLDISCLGEHLFRGEERKHDWATRMCLVFGTADVEAWLKERSAPEVFFELQAQGELVE